MDEFLVGSHKRAARTRLEVEWASSPVVLYEGARLSHLTEVQTATHGSGPTNGLHALFMPEPERPEGARSLIRLDVWTPTPEEDAAAQTLIEQLENATTPEAQAEAQRLVDEEWAAQQRRHRDDATRVSPDPVPDVGRRFLVIALALIGCGAVIMLAFGLLFVVRRGPLGSASDPGFFERFGATAAIAFASAYAVRRWLPRDRPLKPTHRH